MQIVETQITKHEIICIHYKVAGKEYEKNVVIRKDDKGKLMSVSIDDIEITAFDLDILEFLKREGKL